MFFEIDLTPAGETASQRVLETVFAYLEHLRTAPFPAEFYADQARIAALKETYNDRGEGSSLATSLANQVLFYPLEIAERAQFVWGQPDEAAYRRLLNKLTPDNLLVTLAAKGVPTDKTEGIYHTAYSYTEDTGANYEALVHPPAVAEFALPGTNPFLPSATDLVAERPLPLIDEPGLQLLYSADVEFERPQTTLIFRFVPRRDLAGLDAELLLKFYQACLADALEPAAGDASIAGVTHSLSLTLEALKLTVSGFGDSPVRFAEYVADQLLTFEVTPERFAALKEKILRDLRSYEQTEAYMLARDQATAVLREFNYLPSQHVARAPQVTWEETRAFAQKFFASGKIESVIHGHITADQAVTAARRSATSLGAKPAAPKDLLRREHLQMAPGQSVVATGKITGANSAYWALYLLPEETPQLRAAAAVLGKFVSEPFYSELRTKQQLGYIVGSGASSSLDQYLQLFVIQSSAYSPDELRQRAETFLATMPAQLVELTDEAFATLKAGVRANFEEKPKSIAEKAERMFSLGYDHHRDWERRADSLAALESLTKTDVQHLFATVIGPASAKHITVLLSCDAHDPSQAEPTFADRDQWKASQSYQ